MERKLLLFVLAAALKCAGIKSADLFDDQPKILVNDGNLIFESAESKNVTVHLKGRSRFLINNVDVLEILHPTNASGGTSGLNSETETISKLVADVAKLRSMMRGQNGVLNRLDRVEMGVPANSTASTPTMDRQRFTSLTRRITTLEQRVANLTERLTRDHCKSYPCQNGGTCFNMFETFRCECTESYEGPTCSDDVNECVRFAGTDLGCQNGATCFNVPGSYQCYCPEPWKGEHCNRQTIDCLQLPQSEVCGHGTCVQVRSKLGYDCICEQGWRKSNLTQSCTADIDECNEMRPHCSVDPKVLCINTPGSFVCGPCPSGYSGNGFACSDIDECEVNNGGCSVSPRVDCINTRGSSRCGSCPLGYDGDGRVCSISSSNSGRPYQCVDSSICNENAQCVQYPNSQPMCLCRAGYSGNGLGIDGCAVTDVDPCSAMRCKNGGTCAHNGTTPHCVCPIGTSQPFCDRTVDACNSSPCLNGGNCTTGRFGRRYICSCLRGFTGSNCEQQVRRCGGVRNTENGTISYPGALASTYNHNSRCAWLIKTNVTKVLNITFTKFDLEASNDCKFDWLQIHDGRSSSSFMIGRFCGNTLPKGGNIVSTHNQLYLWFRSDNSTSRDGFELTWQSVDPECGGDLNITTHGTISSPGSPGNYPMNRDCEWYVTAPPGKRIQFLFYTLMIEAHVSCGYDFVEIHSGLGLETPSLGKYCNSTNPPPLLTPSHTATVHFHSDGDSNDAGFQLAFSVVEGLPGCGGTYTSPKGDIVSPVNIADGKYKHNIVCDYVIQLPPQSRVRIDFKKFALEDSTGCKFDKVEIFEGNTGDESNLLGRYCGENKPPLITSLTNVVTVKFTSDWSSNDEGFQFTYQLLCGGVYTSESESFSSPNYPDPYDGERNCEYDIIAPQGKAIVLTVLDLDIEAHSQCEFDYLEVFDGNLGDSNATSRGRFCGREKPGLITSLFNHLHVHFSSDASINGRGFSANYSFVDIECGGIIKDVNELIKSPMDKDENGVYKSNAECRWVIVAPKDFIIQINFITFELELDSTCKYDFVKIFDNSTTDAEEIGPFCGTNAPKVLTTTGNVATVYFKTDSSTAKDGFTISVAFVEGSKLCGANYFSSQGFVRSPGKPEYLPNKECEWTITVPNGQQIELIFKFFEMEEHSTCRFDGLEIRNGGNSFAPLIGKFCGSDVPAPIKSFSNQLYLKFYSDSSRGGQGFEIEWDGTSTGCGGEVTTTKGSISSPNHPKPYAHNAQCEWRISVNEGSTIEIIFTDLEMEQQSECRYDYLEIFDGPDASSSSFGRYCSSESHPMHLETSDNHALIRMNTDDSHAGRGFTLKYSIHCNRTIRMDSGVIESPNFPNDYPNNLDCAWTIVVSKGNRVNMQFSHFYVENDNQFHNETNEHVCKYDYLQITDLDFETKSEKSQRMKYCNVAPEIRTSSSDAVVIVFHTDASASGTGFRMEWNVEGCGGKLTHPEGSLTSPNYPKRYDHELTCVWEINAEYGHSIVLTVHDFDMESSSTCEYDSLTVARDSMFNNTIRKICQSISSPTVITSDGHQVFVKFTSDESNNGKGFNITYKTVFSQCGGISVGSSGIISTPNYPTQNYEDNKVCEWNIKTDLSHSLVFQFTDFDIETSEDCSKDYVDVYDPIADVILTRECGSKIPPDNNYQSSRNELNIRLVTDNSITAKGFRGNFSVHCGAIITTNTSGEFQYRRISENYECTWTIKAGDLAKKVVLTFTYMNVFLEHVDGCLSKISVYEGEKISGSARAAFCGWKTPPAIYSYGNALTIHLNSSSLSYLSEFDIHYSVLDNACGGTYTTSIQGGFASPNYPSSSPLNTYCIWSITASAGNKLSLAIQSIDIARSSNCNDNYLEVRRESAGGALVGVYCGDEIPSDVITGEKFWVKYQTDGSSTSAGFLAEYNYIDHSDINGVSGLIESPNYPKFFSSALRKTYRITVQQGSVIRIEFPVFYMDEEDADECFAFIKIYNGYDDAAPLLQDETCSDSPAPITSESNAVFIEFMNNHMSKTKFRIKWSEVDRVINNTGTIQNNCSDVVLSLNTEKDMINITSPGYPYGYDTALSCKWTITSKLPAFHPIIVFKDIDLEDLSGCYGDYVQVSTDRDDGTWKEHEKLCASDLRERKVFEGTPNLKLAFVSDYGTNRTGFSAYTQLECGGKMTESEGIIEYNTTNLFSLYRVMNDCKWNITVRRGKTIQFEFLELNIQNTSHICNSYVTIRNGIDDSSPYVGSGQYCGKDIPKIPPTSSNRAFVKYKVNVPLLNSFKLRYSEVQHSCGGQIRLSANNNSIIVSSPHYPNIPPPHIDCTWTILVPTGERIRVDFIERFDLTFSTDCSKEYVELRDGLTTSSHQIGTFCGEKPVTKTSKSNVMMMKFFTDVAEPKNGFKANISIDVCGGTIRSNAGYLTSPKYPGLGAYPSKARCDYRISGQINHIFNITIVSIDLPPVNGTTDECDETSDHFKIFSIIPDFNGTDEEGNLREVGLFCGSEIPSISYFSDTNEFLVRMITMEKTKNLYKGFKILYQASKTSCGGLIEAPSGIITSPGYPTHTLNKLFCEWKITVPKGRRVKIEFLDVDLLASSSQLLQRIGVYNDFRYSNRLMFLNSNSSLIEPLYSSDNRMMVTMWVRLPSSNRGFKLKFSSDDSTVCDGNLNDQTGGIFPPLDLNLTSYTCDYIRDPTPIVTENRGTLAYYFKNISVGKKITNCRYASTVINVKRRPGVGVFDDETFLAQICGNTTTSLTVLSPFPDVNIEVRQNPFFGQINYTMHYKTFNCGGMFSNGEMTFIRNSPANISNEAILDCAWFVKYQEGFSVSISFSQLKMKLPCEQEYIQVYNGPTALSPSIGKFCGTDASRDVMVSQKNTIFIEYHTDNFVGSSKDSVFEIKLESASFGCGGILNKNNHRFMTPLYMKGYPPNTECIWEIRAESGYHVGLTFEDRFNIETTTNCSKDYLEVFDFVNDDWTSLGRRCGRNVPEPFNSTAEKMKVIFRSDSSSTAEGFKALWTQNCGGIFEVDETPRLLSSPGFPKLYGSNLICNYTLVAKDSKSFINLNFLEFAVETTGSKCMYDNITIWKNSDYSYTVENPPEKVGTFCGTTNPGKFRHRAKTTIVFQSDRWVERKGFQVEYKLDNCGGTVTNSSMISSPTFPDSNSYYGVMHCAWNITAPDNKKIIIKFENFSMEHSDYCSNDYIEIFNGTKVNDSMRLAKICGNLTNVLKPIIINNNQAIIRLSTYQTTSYLGFSAIVSFKPKCDQNFVLDNDRKTIVIDKMNQVYSESMECVYKISGVPMSALKLTFDEMHLSICDPDKNSDPCNCDYVEVLDGNGPFSEVIGRFCGHNSSRGIVSSSSSLYIRFVTDSLRPSTGFKARITMIESPCGSVPYMNFTANNTNEYYVLSPLIPGSPNYVPNIRCTWIAEASAYGKIFEIQFSKFELEDSPFCVNDSLTIQDYSMSSTITEGLGEEVIYRGKSSATHSPSFYSGIVGPTAPHVYCGSGLPPDFLSQTNKIKISFRSNEQNEFSGFNFTIRTMKSCSRNFTALQGRLVSDDALENCRSFIKVPENYTISLYFNKFFSYENDCTKTFLKIYDGDFENGVLMKTLCGYATPDPIFSTRNQISLVFQFEEGSQHYMRGNYDFLYVATDKGQGCGGEIFNYGGLITSPLYPSSNRTVNNCYWSLTVPQNLKVALRFTIFDMGSKLLCESDYVELLEEDESGESTSIKKFCGEDDPAIYVSTRSKIIIHHVQTLNFAGTGWILNFMGIHEGAKPQNW